MSTCKAQLSRLEQRLDTARNQTASLEQQLDEQYSLLQAMAIDRKDFLGPLLIGSLVEILLFGILIMQMWNYHRSFHRDMVFLKLAWTSFLGSFALIIAIFVDSWDRFIVSNIVNIQDSMTVSSEIATIMIALLGLLSQVFFAWRIHELSRKRWLQVLICCLAIMQFAVFVVVNVHSMIAMPRKDQFDFISTASSSSLWIKDPSTPTWMGANIACDLTITVSMAILLYPTMKEATLDQTWVALSKILNLVFETGIVSLILAIIMTGFLFSKTPSMQYTRLILFYPSGVLYSTWLLTSLCTRPSTAEQTSSAIIATGIQSTHLGDIRFRSYTTTQQHEVIVNITTTVEGHRDDVDELSIESSDEKQTRSPKTGTDRSPA